MAVLALPNALQPLAVQGRMSRLRVNNDTLQRAFGMQDGGPNVKPSILRSSTYDIFNDTREVGTAVLPAGQSVTVQRNPSGKVAYTIPRHAENLPILMETLVGLRSLGGTDVGGLTTDEMSFVGAQEKYMKQRMVNIREFQVAAMCRGSYTFTQVGGGTTLVHGFSGGSITVDFQIPSGNKTTLDMLGAGAIIGSNYWSNAATDIPSQLEYINKAFIQLTGYPLDRIMLDGIAWLYVITNTAVKALAGSVNRPWAEWSVDDKGDGACRIAGMPQYKFYVVNQGLTLNTTPGKSIDPITNFTQLIPSNRAVFSIDPSVGLVEYLDFPAPIVTQDGASPIRPGGMHSWYETARNPAQYVINTEFNGLPALKIPNGIAFGSIAA